MDLHKKIDELIIRRVVTRRRHADNWSAQIKDDILTTLSKEHPHLFSIHGRSLLIKFIDIAFNAMASTSDLRCKDDGWYTNVPYYPTLRADYDYKKT